MHRKAQCDKANKYLFDAQVASRFVLYGIFVSAAEGDTIKVASQNPLRTNLIITSSGSGIGQFFFKDQSGELLKIPFFSIWNDLIMSFTDHGILVTQEIWWTRVAAGTCSVFGTERV